MGRHRKAKASPSLAANWRPHLKPEEQAELDRLEGEIAAAEQALAEHINSARKAISVIRRARGRVVNRVVCRVAYRMYGDQRKAAHREYYRKQKEKNRAVDPS